LYSSIVGLSGDKPKRNSRVQSLFDKFIVKNQDLELNILKAQGKIDGGKF
jgi:hypothetical protein